MKQSAGAPLDSGPELERLAQSGRESKDRSKWRPTQETWTYSSNRVIYSNKGVVSWWYRYVLKRGMARGAYYYRTSFGGSSGYLKSMSSTVKVAVR